MGSGLGLRRVAGDERAGLAAARTSGRVAAAGRGAALSRWLRPPRPLDPEAAREYVLNLLGRRAHTVAEVRTRLLGRGVSGADADALIARLREVGLLDDGAFSRTCVDARLRERGPLALRRELRLKGVAEELIDQALARQGDADEAASARALLRKQAWRFRVDAPEDRPAAVARAFAMLARRGFTPDAARAAVAEVLGAADDE